MILASGAAGFIGRRGAPVAAGRAAGWPAPETKDQKEQIPSGIIAPVIGAENSDLPQLSSPTTR